MYCRQCGKNLPDTAEKCEGCNTKIGKGSRFCPNCGEKSNNKTSCSSCGFDFTTKNNVGAPKYDLPLANATVSYQSSKQETVQPVVQRVEPSAPVPQPVVSARPRVPTSIPQNNSAPVQNELFGRITNQVQSNANNPFLPGVSVNPLRPVEKNTPTVRPDNFAAVVKGESINPQNPSISQAAPQKEKASKAVAPKKEVLKKEKENSDENTQQIQTKPQVTMFGLSAMMLALGFMFTSSFLFLITGGIACLLAIFKKDYQFAGAAIIGLIVMAINVFLL